MARVIPQSVYRRGYQHKGWGASRQTKGADQWLSPEGVKSAVAITDTVGGVIAATVQKKQERDEILEEFELASELSKLAKEARLEGEGPKTLALQKRLLAAGGKLPGYGADSKWGSETELALKTAQDKRAEKLFGKGAKGEQFTQYDIAQKRAGTPFGRTRALFGEDEGEYEAMQAARARVAAFEDRALSRRSAEEGYRQAAGADTMAKREASAQLSLSAWNRQRAATLSGLASGAGQAAITKNLRRLYPARKPAPRGGYTSRPPRVADPRHEIIANDAAIRGTEMGMMLRGKRDEKTGKIKIKDYSVLGDNVTTVDAASLPTLADTEFGPGVQDKTKQKGQVYIAAPRDNRESAALRDSATRAQMYVILQNRLLSWRAQARREGLPEHRKKLREKGKALRTIRGASRSGSEAGRQQAIKITDDPDSPYYYEEPDQGELLKKRRKTQADKDKFQAEEQGKARLKWLRNQLNKGQQDAGPEPDQEPDILEDSVHGRPAPALDAGPVPKPDTGPAPGSAEAAAGLRHYDKGIRKRKKRRKPSRRRTPEELRQSYEGSPDAGPPDTGPRRRRVSPSGAAVRPSEGARGDNPRARAATQERTSQLSAEQKAKHLKRKKIKVWMMGTNGRELRRRKISRRKFRAYAQKHTLKEAVEKFLPGYSTHGTSN